ncbi:hypothetical protein [Streptosporangium sandarakinum]|uniref:hypothetical protein n=1 Tax=Streptosporangium sandarakinum TaxID=1260955 RepID=UPI0037A48EC0
MIVQRAAGPLRVTARTRGKSWIYQWGRGRNQWINALDEWASWTIHKAAAR